jgi:predicted DNA-binding transcriptional regulator AlpA
MVSNSVTDRKGPTMTAISPLLTVKELASELGLDTDTVYRWVAEDAKPGTTGQRLPVPAIRLGRSIRFRRTDVDRLLYGDAA